MRSMDSYSKAVMELAMKIHEVILRAMAKKISWWQAAEFSVLATGICGAFGNGTKSSVMTGCSTLAWANLPPSRISECGPSQLADMVWLRESPKAALRSVEFAAQSEAPPFVAVAESPQFAPATGGRRRFRAGIRADVR